MPTRRLMLYLYLAETSRVYNTWPRNAALQNKQNAYSSPSSSSSLLISNSSGTSASSPPSTSSSTALSTPAAAAAPDASPPSALDSPPRFDTSCCKKSFMPPMSASVGPPVCLAGVTGAPAPSCCPGCAAGAVVFLRALSSRRVFFSEGVVSWRRRIPGVAWIMCQH